MSTEDDLPRVAAITVVRDEAVMLPRWIAYYGAQLGVDNLLVIDDQTADRSTEGLPCPVIKIPPIRDGRFEKARLGMANGLASGLLSLYDAVIFADADEFVVADPENYPSLRHYVASSGRPISGVIALNVVHHIATEPALDPGRPILEQRSYAKFARIMCKPALKRVPATWCWGSHGIRAEYAVDGELFMFHMKFADRDLLMASSDHRKRLVEADGRAVRTSWRLGSGPMAALLDQVAADDVDAVPTFDPPPSLVAKLAQQRPDGSWKATGWGQMRAMEQQPLVRIPGRFTGVV